MGLMLELDTITQNVLKLRLRNTSSLYTEIYTYERNQIININILLCDVYVPKMAI